MSRAGIDGKRPLFSKRLVHYRPTTRKRKRKVINLSNYTLVSQVWACCRGGQNRLRARLAAQRLDVPDDVVGGLVPEPVWAVRQRRRLRAAGPGPVRRARDEEAMGTPSRWRGMRARSVGKWPPRPSFKLASHTSSSSGEQKLSRSCATGSHRNRAVTTFNYVQGFWQCSDASRPSHQHSLSQRFCRSMWAASVREPQAQQSTPPPRQPPRH